ncbi:hypothetical protein ABT299_36365 [Spirillospora sp. NPDC000708]
MAFRVGNVLEEAAELVEHDGVLAEADAALGRVAKGLQGAVAGRFCGAGIGIGQGVELRKRRPRVSAEEEDQRAVEAELEQVRVFGAQHPRADR